jgi:hypothetical protein
MQIKAARAGLADTGGMPLVEPTPVPLPAFRSSPAAENGAPASTVFLPKEHGSWSLAFEPLALGLLVAPSSAGAALALAAGAGFFARRPFKAALAPDATHRRRTSRVAVVLLSALAVAGLYETLMLGGFSSLWPLLLAAPFGGLFVWFDAQNESRAAAAELAGSTTFALLPAAFATLAGWSWPMALGLSAVGLIRSVPTVLTVRAGLRRSKGQPVGVLAPLAGSMLAFVLAATLAAQRVVPAAIAGLAGLLLLRTALFLSPMRPGWSARRIGIFEAVLGVFYVGVTVLAYRMA